MLNFISDLFGRDNSLSPHGICLLWRPELISIHAISDISIGLAYFSIPIFLGYLAYRRPDVGFGWVVWCFAAFILACGTTHFFSTWTLWHAAYGIEALVKVVTALLSITTAVVLWPLLPKALAWPSPSQLSAANEALSRSIRERDQALESLKLQIAERERAEQMLRQAQKMEAVGQLTGGIAHDFNNLLTAIWMNLDRINREAGAPPESKLQRAVANAVFATQRATTLTGRMLAFARQQKFEPMLLDVNVILAELEPLISNALGTRGRLALRLEPGLDRIYADRNQLESAVLNLVVNAGDAMPNGGDVTISTRQSGNAVRVEVADTGLGMSSEVQAHAFEPFFTTKPVGKGSGLGLSQVYGFMQESNGYTEIFSRPGEGTKIVLEFPAANSPQPLRAGQTV